MKLAIFTSLFATSAAFAPAAVVTHQRSSSTTTALNVAVDTSEIKNGLTIELDGEPYKVLSFSIMKQARGAAKTTIKFKNLKRGSTIENTYRSGEKFETAEIIRKPSQYTYEDEAGNCFFMDSESFEEVMVPFKVIEDQKKWIVEGMECDLVFFKGECIEVRAPNPYVYEIVETEPNVKGNTAQGYTKPAVLSCGATVSVPGFVEQGTMIKVDTEKGEYMERV
jgi:elongation factor P